jgi:hypothetical protein
VSSWILTFCDISCLSEGQTLPDNLEEDVKKDVSTLISRVGDYRAEAKVKWIDFAREILSTTTGDEYRVSYFLPFFLFQLFIY